MKTERIRTAQRRGRQRAPATSAEWAVLAGNVNSCFLWVLRLQAGVSLSGPPLEHSGGSSVSLRPQPLCSTHSPRRFQQLHISPIQSDTMLTANTTHTHTHTAERVYHFLCASACFICLCCFNLFSCLRKRHFSPPPNWAVGVILKHSLINRRWTGLWEIQSLEYLSYYRC